MEIQAVSSKELRSKLRFGDAIKNARLSRSLSLDKASSFCKIPTIRLCDLERQISTHRPSPYEIKLLNKVYSADFQQYTYDPDFELIEFETDVLDSMKTNSPKKIKNKYGIEILKQ
jgi:hypothetical protein